jgi:hypothetical protein
MPVCEAGVGTFKKETLQACTIGLGFGYCGTERISGIFERHLSC